MAERTVLSYHRTGQGVFLPDILANEHRFVRNGLVFYLNGSRVTIDGEAAFDSLAQWLRERRGLVGTKIVCNEGDCGACSVLVGRRAANGQHLVYQTLDACIVFLFQLDGTHVVTVEGFLREGRLSCVQEAMMKHHASQCGFCTPGFVVAMHGMLEADESFTEPSLRYSLSGNLCRCTGYVPILQAGMATDVARYARLSECYPEPPILEDFANLGAEPIQMSTSAGRIFIPRTLEQATALRSAYPRAMLVSGATDYGVLRNHGRIQASDTICLSNVEDFSEIKIEDGVMTIGGGVTWRAIEAFVRDRIPEYHAIVARFGSPQIRNAGTLAGNLASGSPIADAVPFHVVLQAELELTSVRGRRRVRIEDFLLDYRKTALAEDELIAAIHTPLLKADERLKLFKISKRRDMDISTATLGLWLKLDRDRIQDARLAIGGVGPTVMRIGEAEACLVGQRMEEQTFRQAGVATRQAIQPWSDVRGGADYRLQLAENLLLKCFLE